MRALGCHCHVCAGMTETCLLRMLLLSTLPCFVCDEEAEQWRRERPKYSTAPLTSPRGSKFVSPVLECLVGTFHASAKSPNFSC